MIKHFFPHAHISKHFNNSWACIISRAFNLMEEMRQEVTCPGGRTENPAFTAHFAAKTSTESNHWFIYPSPGWLAAAHQGFSLSHLCLRMLKIEPWIFGRQSMCFVTMLGVFLTNKESCLLLRQTTGSLSSTCPQFPMGVESFLAILGRMLGTEHGPCAYKQVLNRKLD